MELDWQCDCSRRRRQGSEENGDSGEKGKSCDGFVGNNDAEWMWKRRIGWPTARRGFAECEDIGRSRVTSENGER